MRTMLSGPLGGPPVRYRDKPVPALRRGPDRMPIQVPFPAGLDQGPAPSHRPLARTGTEVSLRPGILGPGAGRMGSVKTVVTASAELLRADVHRVSSQPPQSTQTV